jgi:hypothetical protein
LNDEVTSVSHLASRLIGINFGYQFSSSSMKINDKNFEKGKTNTNENELQFEDSSSEFHILHLELFSSLTKRRLLDPKFNLFILIGIAFV